MTAKDKGFDKQAIATTLIGCVQEIFTKTCHLTFSKEPEYVEREIIEYNSRMRIFGLEKFNGPCYIAVVNFYLNKREYEAKNVQGVMVLYILEEIIEKLMKALNFEGVGSNEEDVESILNGCGEFCNMIAGQFKNALPALGYSDLVISAPSKYVNDIPDGVEFHYGEYKLYE